MQDASLPKSSVDAPPDQGAPDLNDFSFLKPLQSFTSVKTPFTVAGSVERKLANLSERKLANPLERKLANPLERKLANPLERKLANPLERKLAILHFAFQLEGDLTSLDVPLSQVSKSRSQKDELWKATCFEIFLSRPGDLSYFEFNFSPTGDFAVYTFDDYRSDMQPLKQLVQPKFKFERGSDFYRITGAIGDAHDDPRFKLLLAEPKLEASMTAVIKPLPGQGETTFWALSHAGKKADFHLRSSFGLSLNEF